MIGVLNSAVSLYYYVRVVVFMYLKKEIAGSHPTVESGADVHAGRRPSRRRSCWASIRACCSRWRKRRRARSAPAASLRRAADQRARQVNFFTRYAILRQFVS